MNVVLVRRYKEQGQNKEKGRETWHAEFLCLPPISLPSSYFFTQINKGTQNIENIDSLKKLHHGLKNW